MDYDRDKFDNFTLALFFLVSTDLEGGLGARAWKGWDAATISRLVKKGWISDPKNYSMTYDVSPEGFEQSKKLFNEHFRVEKE